MEIRVADGARNPVGVSQDLHAAGDLRLRIACVCETHDVPLHPLRQLHGDMTKLAWEVLMKKKDAGFRHTC
jgi:hypothetical protein